MAARGCLMKTRNFYAGNIKMALLYELCSATAPSPVSRVPIDARSLKKAILSKFLLFQPLMELSGIIDSSNRCALSPLSRSSPEGEPSRLRIISFSRVRFISQPRMCRGMKVIYIRARLYHLCRATAPSPDSRTTYSFKDS